MSRYKNILFIAALVLGLRAQAQDASAVTPAAPAPGAVTGLSAPAPAPRRPVARRRARHRISHTAIGIGYMTWNEDITARSATDRSNGVASYGGAAIFVEQSWNFSRWRLGVNVTFGSGKASGSVSGNVSYSDGTNRAWSAIVLEPFARYAINAYVYLGAGLLYRHTNVTWSTADATVTLEPASKTEVTGQFDFKIELTKHWSLAQSYAPIGFRARSEWLTSAAYTF